jgi:type I site-specific restriction-modification system R (restriction) subunit
MDEDKQKTIAIIADEAHRSHGRKSTRTMHGTATSLVNYP